MRVLHTRQVNADQLGRGSYPVSADESDGIERVAPTAMLQAASPWVWQGALFGVRAERLKPNGVDKPVSQVR